jgi:hypothetical protein
MKKQLKLLMLTLTSFVGMSLAQAQPVPPAFPRPLVYQREAGKYLADIEKLQSLLNQKKGLEFYEEVDKIFSKIKKIRKEENRDSENVTREEKVLSEWIFYYTIKLPLMQNEEMDKHHVVDRPDVMRKLFICSRFCKENIAETAKLLSVDEKSLLRNRVETTTDLLSFLRKVENYANDTQLHRNETAVLMEQLQATEEAYMEEIRRNKGATGYSGFSPAGQLLWNKIGERDLRRSSLVQMIPLFVGFCEEPYVRKLLECFPNQEKTIHEYIKKSNIARRNPKRYLPLPAEVEIANLLRRTVGRSKETAWLYKGLPSEEKILKIREIEIKKSEEVMKRERKEEERKAMEDTKKQNPPPEK